MNLSGRKFDSHMVGEDGGQILFGECDEMKEWVPVLARQLEVGEDEITKMMDELRIFFVLVLIGSRCGAFMPQNPAPTQPPPKLARLWATMAADDRNYNKFLAVTGIRSELGFQTEYPPNRLYTPQKGAALMRLAGYADLPTDLTYWQ